MTWDQLLISSFAEAKQIAVHVAVHFWLRFVTLWFAVASVGFAEGYVLWPFGFASFRWRRRSHRACSLASCAEVATLTSGLIRRCHPQFG
jgi:hypothetical protein